MKSLDASASLSLEKRGAAFALLLWFVLLWLFFDGFYFYDDIYYVRKAVELLQGKLHLHYLMDHRVGLYVPVAFFIALGGMHEWTVLAYPVICVFLLCVLLWRYNSWGWVAVLFLITDYYVFYFAAKLYPDTVLMLWVSVACMALERRSGGSKPALIMVGALFIAFLTKETVIWLLPALLWILAQDLLRRQHLLFWRYACLLGGVLLALYFGYYAWRWGHPFYRFLLIQAEHSPNCGAFSYYDKPWIYTLRRITYQPLLMFVGADMWTAIAGALLAVVMEWRRKRALSVWSISFLGMLCMFWFFTTSFRYYNPITLHARMVLPLVPLAAGVLARNFFSFGKKAMGAWGGLLWAASLWCFYGGNYPLATLYFLEGGVLCLGAFYEPLRRFALPALVALGFVHPAYAAYKTQTQGTYKDEKYLLQKYFSKAGNEHCIMTDNRLATGGDFYFAFQQDAPRLQDLLLADSTATNECTTVWLLKNEQAWHEYALLGTDYVAAFEPQAWQLVECRGRVCLYRKRP